MERATLPTSPPASVLEAIGDVIIDYASDGTVIWASPALLTVLGYDPAEVVGTRLRLSLDEDREQADEAVAEALARGASTARTRLRLRCADGSAKWTDCLAHVVRDESGALQHIVVVIRDATDEVDSAERFRLAMEHSAIGMALVAPGGAFLAANPALCEMLGRDAVTLMGCTWQELTHPDDLAEDESLVAELLSGQRDSYRLRKRYLHADGTVLWGDLSVSAVRDAAGQVAYFVSQILEVSDQVASEERYRLLAENSSDIVALVGPDGMVGWISPSVTSVLGWAPGDLMGRAPWELIHADDREPALTALAESMAADGDAPSIEVRVRTTSDDYVWVSALGRQASPTQMVVSFRLVDEEVRAREALAASQERYRLLAENSSDVVAHSAPDGTVLWMSPSVENLLGWSPDFLVGRPVFDVIHPDDLPAIMAAQPSIRAGEAMNFEARVQTADGGYRWLAAHVRPILDDAGTLVGRVVGWRDIENEHAARVALQEAEERFRLLAENASDVVFAAGPDRLVTWVSPSVTRVLGWQPDELVGTVMADLVHPDDRDRTDQARDRLYAGIEVENPRGGYVVRMRGRDGAYHWVSSSFTILRDEAGNQSGLVGGLAIVDDLVEARLQAERDEALLKASADAQLDPQVLLEAVRAEDGRVIDFVYVDVNRATLEYLGMAEEELIGSGVLQSLPGLAEAGLFDAYLEVLRTHEPAALDGFRYANEILGVEAFYDIRVTYVSDDRVSLTWRDVTERAQAAERVERSEERLRATIDSMIDPHVVLKAVRDEGGMIVDFVFAEANAAAAAFNGVSRDDLIGVSLLGQHPAAGATSLFADYVHVVETGEPFIRDDWEYPQDMLGGEVRRYDVRAVKLGDGLSQSWRDVTERYAAARRIAESEERFRLLAENSSDVILQAQDGVLKWLSPSLTAALGWDPEDWVGHTLEEYTHPDDVELVRQRWAEISAGATAVTTLRLRDRGGDHHWVEVHAGPYTREGEAYGIVGSFRIIDDEVAAREALAAAEQHYRLLAENSTDVIGHARAGRIVWISPSVTGTLGGEPEEWIGRDLAEVLHPDDLPRHEASLSWTGEQLSGIVRARVRAADGRYHWIEAHTGPFIDADGHEDGIIAAFRVVDDLVEAERELDYRVRFDTLTGLANRKEVLQRITAITSGNRQPGEYTAVLFCDIDHFKDVNDTYGHAAGDEVLRTLAERISATVRQEDLAARIGGDELLVVLTGIHSLEEATAIAEKIRAAASVSIGLEHGRVTSTLSIGVTLVRPGESTDALVARADQAMYDAKQSGRNRVVTIA